MNANDPFLFRQLQVIQKIIQDETWLEGERRGCEVPPDDRLVRENVCQVILRIGKEMREAAMTAVTRESSTASCQFEERREPALPMYRNAAA